MDGDTYVRQLAAWVRKHERAFADVLLPANRRSVSKGPMSWATGGTSATIPPLVLPLDPHHLAYLLLRFEEAGIPLDSLGPIDSALDAPASRPMSYVGLVDPNAKMDDRAETQSMLSAVSSLGSRWWGGGTPPHVPVPTDARYLYSSFTVLPALKLGPTAPLPSDRFIASFETLPDDRFVPLYAFKNLSILALRDLDPRAFLGWDHLAECLRSLEISGSGIEDFSELLVDRVLADEARRKAMLVRKRATQRRRRHPDEDDDQTSDDAVDPPADAASTTLGPSKWAQLRALSLAGNYLTFLPTEPLVHLDRLVRLDLSGNLLVGIPSGLSALISLRSLDLSDNMIDSVLAIYKIIGAIQHLNISRNRIESLCGLERLMALERIDLRENRIDDVGEIGRLAVLPGLRELSVEGNPFTTHALHNARMPWRIACFNAFAAAGRDRAEVKLDGTVPSYNERRQIIAVKRTSERSAGDSSGMDESDHRTRAKSPLNPIIVARSPPGGRSRASSSMNVPTSPVKALPGDATGLPVSPQVVRVKPKRRRPIRVVDIDGGGPHVAPSTTAAESDAALSDDAAGPTNGHVRSASHGSPTKTTSQRALGHGRAATEHSRSSPQRAKVSAATFQPPMPAKLNFGDDAFRRRIEALRQEVGDNWLSALGDEGAVPPPAAVAPIVEALPATSDTPDPISTSSGS